MWPRGVGLVVEPTRLDERREEVADTVYQVGDVVRVKQTVGRWHRTEHLLIDHLKGIGRIGRVKARRGGDEVIRRIEVEPLWIAGLAPVVGIPLVALALRGVVEPFVVRLVGGEQGGAGNRIEAGRFRLEELASGIEARDVVDVFLAGGRRIMVVRAADVSIPREVEHLGRGEVEVLRIGIRLAREPDVVRIGDVVAAVPVADDDAVPVVPWP